MKFNILRLTNGNKIGTVKAINIDEAEKICLKKGLNIYDDYFLETDNDLSKVPFSKKEVAKLTSNKYSYNNDCNNWK